MIDHPYEVQRRDRGEWVWTRAFDTEQEALDARAPHQRVVDVRTDRVIRPAGEDAVAALVRALDPDLFNTHMQAQAVAESADEGTVRAALAYLLAEHLSDGMPEVTAQGRRDAAAAGLMKETER